MTYFISGHRDLTWEEFTKWYTPLITTIYHTDKDAKFIVADCKGCDSMTQDYLLALGVSLTKIVIYHMGNIPRYLAAPAMPTKNGYVSDIDRDETMTEHSDCDIAFICRGKESSGTAQNILRRWTKY